MVPAYADLLAILALTVARHCGPAPLVLDLGCGTGNAALAVRERCPRARFFLLDGSARMVGAAAEKIAAAAPGALVGRAVVDLAVADQNQLPVGGPFDAVISSLVLEHLSEEPYRRVLAAVRARLAPGGLFAAVEGYDEPGTGQLRWYEEEMAARQQALADRDLADFVATLRAAGETHYFTSRAEKLAWWRAAGFARVQNVWQYLCLGLMAGWAPGDGFTAGPGGG